MTVAVQLSQDKNRLPVLPTPAPGGPEGPTPASVKCRLLQDAETRKKSVYRSGMVDMTSYGWRDLLQCNTPLLIATTKTTVHLSQTSSHRGILIAWRLVRCKAARPEHHGLQTAKHCAVRQEPHPNSSRAYSMHAVSPEKQISPNAPLTPYRIPYLIQYRIINARLAEWHTEQRYKTLAQAYRRKACSMYAVSPAKKSHLTHC